MQNDPSAAYGLFIGTYAKTFNKYFPEKVIRVNRKHIPLKEWITKGLLRSCNKKSQVFKRYKITSALTDKNKYIKYWNLLKSLIRKAKQSHCYDKFKSLTGDIQNTWKLLNSIIKIKPSKKLDNIS